MLVELAIGDAYSAGFEYVRDRRFINRFNDLTGNAKHPTHNLRPGEYTDDTQMSPAIAELVLEVPLWTPQVVADKFVECFHRDPREGYSGRFHQFLKKHKTGAQFLADINPTSDKSGAAMRAAPIGTYPRISEVVEKCAMQARITHDTADGTNAALAVSVGVHYFLYGLGPKSGLPQYIKDHVNGNWSEPWLGEVGSKAYMSVRAAITSILMNNSLSSILRSAVAWGGDTDTTASIAMRLASCCNEITKDLPENLLRDLEDGD